MIVLIVLGIAAVIFVLQNSESHSIDFLFLDFTAPQWVIFAILLVVGAALDRLAAVLDAAPQGAPALVTGRLTGRPAR